MYDFTNVNSIASCLYAIQVYKIRDADDAAGCLNTLGPVLSELVYSQPGGSERLDWANEIHMKFFKSVEALKNPWHMYRNPAEDSKNFILQGLKLIECKEGQAFKNSLHPVIQIIVDTMALVINSVVIEEKEIIVDKPYSGEYTLTIQYPEPEYDLPF